MSQPVPDVGPTAPTDRSSAEVTGGGVPTSVEDHALPVPDEGPAVDVVAEGLADVDPDFALDLDPGDVDPDLPRFRLAFVPGATPGKWASVWRERLSDVHLELVQVDVAAVESVLEAGEADAAIGRLPVDKDVFSAIPLYEEASVVCFSRDHLLAALAEDEVVSSADIAEEPVWVPADDVLFATHAAPGVPPAGPDGNLLEQVPTTADAVATVASNVGLAVLPLSLARLHRRKDVTYRPLVDGPTAPVGLIWPTDRTTDLVEELIGIVRGRTVNSSRGRGGPSRSAQEAASDGGTGGKTARAGVKNSTKGAPAGAKGRSGAVRRGTKAGSRGGIQQGKAARSTPKGKKKGKGR